jgi:hypothetical protein
LPLSPVFALMMSSTSTGWTRDKNSTTFNETAIRSRKRS